MKFEKTILFMEYVVCSIVESEFIYYLTNYYLQGILLIDILFSLLFHLNKYIYNIIQIMNYITFFVILFFNSIRPYCLFWLFIIFKNDFRKFLIDTISIKKNQPLLLDDENNNNFEENETRTVISV